MHKDFTFLNPGELHDKELRLVLMDTLPPDESKGYVPCYKFEMHEKGTDAKMGTIQLRIGKNENIYYGGHIGYSVDPVYRGNRLAARSVTILKLLAKRHAMEELTITCDPDNIASRKTCELAGAELIEIVDLPEHNEMYKSGDRKVYRYRIRI